MSEDITEDDLDEEEAEKPVMRGTPITRAGGRFIRVGWRAEGYSVSSGAKTAYQVYTILLFLLAIAVGITVAYWAEFVFFNFASPLIAKVWPDVKNYPSLFQLLIYYSTLFFGGIIFWHIRTMVGRRLAKGAVRLHEGYGPVEQRRRAAIKRKRDFLSRIIYAGLLWYVLRQVDAVRDHFEVSEALLLFLVSLPLIQVVEAIFLFFWKPKA